MAQAAHQVTHESKIEVKTLKSFGVTNEEIANYLDISADTLRKYYQRELTTGRIHANAEVARHLFLQATEKENVTAMIFWLKTRAGWRPEDDKSNSDANDEMARQLKELRAKLDTEYKRDY